ncbi:Holliday junction resolvase RuvX [candidate division KSB1 bacterium]|jgi:putative Holliday junction resolvase|nr:Holliday junction resolvase RuvX [candidate division KSB1 bacterium]
MLAESKDLKTVPQGRVLGVDYGEKRIGCALSDPMQMLASPLITLNYLGPKQIFRELRRIIKEQNVVAMVIGMPFHLNGRIGDKATQVKEFAEHAKTRLTVPVYLWDERWTTVNAEKSMQARGLSPSKHRDRIDQVAAAFILQGFLDRLSNSRALVSG